MELKVLTKEERLAEKLESIKLGIQDLMYDHYNTQHDPIGLSLVSRRFGASGFKWGFMNIINALDKEKKVKLMEDSQGKRYLWPPQLFDKETEEEVQKEIKLRFNYLEDMRKYKLLNKKR